MAKSIHELPESQIDELVFAAIHDEHRQTRRPVATSMVFVAVNAGSDVDRNAAILSLGRLSRAGKVKRESPASAWSPVAGADRPLPDCTAPTPPPTRDGRGGDAMVMATPSVRPRSRDTMPTVPKQAASEARKAYANATKAMAGLSQAAKASSAPALDSDLLDRCAAMNMTLIEQARDAYAQGVPSAGRELLWLMETGRQLSEAGGSACE